MGLTCQDPRDRARRQLAELLSAEGDFDSSRRPSGWPPKNTRISTSITNAPASALICSEGARRVHQVANPFARLDGLRIYLFEELGFRGNLEQYNDPRNSFFNEVLDRRLGIPLTLSILFIEQARAAGFDAAASGCPVTSSRVRPSTAARSSSIPSRRERDNPGGLQGAGGPLDRPRLAFRPTYLEGTKDRAMLARLLMNLKYAYLGRTDYTRALVRRRTTAPGLAGRFERDPRPGLPEGSPRPARAAIADLERYLTMTPDAPDMKSVEVVWSGCGGAPPRRTDTPTALRNHPPYPSSTMDHFAPLEHNVRPRRATEALTISPGSGGARARRGRATTKR